MPTDELFFSTYTYMKYSKKLRKMIRGKLKQKHDKNDLKICFLKKFSEYFFSLKTMFYKTLFLFFDVKLVHGFVVKNGLSFSFQTPICCSNKNLFRSFSSFDYYSLLCKISNSELPPILLNFAFF